MNFPVNVSHRNRPLVVRCSLAVFALILILTCPVGACEYSFGSTVVDDGQNGSATKSFPGQGSYVVAAVAGRRHAIRASSVQFRASVDMTLLRIGRAEPKRHPRMACRQQLLWCDDRRYSHNEGSLSISQPHPT